MEVGLVRQIDIDVEMQQSYLDYAMSVIVARALPDARDGLKPVHRRILYAMHAMGIRPTLEYKKSARIVGEVLGKYHPHGDMTVYEAMARMAQDFSMRYPLIDGQGNFGSVDGDPPAAMRYTEARLAPLAVDMLLAIDKETVDFSDNFDGTLYEPVVLPTAVPNLLVNGSTGIAVGMATSIPPHNMTEVCNALAFMLENWSRLEKVGVEDLLQFIQGPDFPTGGIILQEKGDGEGLIAAYATGRGRIVVQAKAHVEEMGRGRTRIIVTELPYLTNKSSLIERIAELARGGDLEGLSDLRDESDRQGLRIVLELAKTAQPEKVLAELYRRTPMQSTFGVNMLALVDGEPRLLSLKQALRVYLEHRLQVIQRRSAFELARAREHAHILEGYRVALDHLDEVIKLIRAAPDTEQARLRLMKRLMLSDAQARAILELPLKRLSALERKKIEEDYRATQARIRDLEALLSSEKKQRAAIIEELNDLKSRFGDRRLTQIYQAKRGRQGRQLLTADDLAPAKDTWVVVTTDGLVSRTPTARLPRLAGRSTPALLLGATARDTLYLFDRRGQGCALAVHTLPECDDPKDGNAVAGATAFGPGADVVAGVVLPADRSPSAQAHLLLGTRSGMLKKTSLETLPGPSAKTFLAINLSPGDALGWARLTSGQDDLVLISRFGAGIRFSEDEIRPTGLGAGGVLGMRLEDEDCVVGMDPAPDKSEVLLVTDRGQAKRVDLGQFPLQRRNGRGVRAWKLEAGDAVAAAAVGSPEDRAVVHLHKSADRSIALSDAPRRTRGGRGKTVAEVRESDRVVALTVPQSRAASVERQTRPAQKTGVRGRSNSPTRAASRGSASSKAKGTAARSKTGGRPSPSQAKPRARRGKTPKAAQPKPGTRKPPAKAKR
ncbi:MAG: DNA topoisomerase 4 subunit A [Anaerolineales bacterium]|nr:DNA topoisomerase 4 subunit A [Anaerolineales bacterium]